MTEIYLIRHGEAEGNVFCRFHGQYESLLTPRGHLQVGCVEKRFEHIHIDACYSSDMTRTSLTARSVYIPKGLPLRRDSRFREACVGVWEDMPFGWLYRFAGEQMDILNADPEKQATQKRGLFFISAYWAAPSGRGTDCFQCCFQYCFRCCP